MGTSASSVTGRAACAPRRAAGKARIGRFAITRTLGKGSQGTVYLARDTELERPVAIKLLRARGDGAEAVREARVVAGLEHAHIVPVYEIGVHKGRSYIVYQYVEGKSLRDRLAKGGELPVHQAVRWAMEVLDAVGHAHAHRIVHRDLNPANIRIDGHDAARVLDFGISAMVGEQSDVSVVGTASYLAPEQISAGTIGPWTDVFSLSLVLHEMLTGTPAVDAADSMSAMYKIAHEPIAPPSSRSDRVDAELDAIVLQGLEKDPKARYATAKAMRDALAAWLDRGEPDDDREESESASALKFILRRMRRKSDFPAISANITEIRRKTTATEQTSVGEVANIILKDYALSTKLLKLVNSSFHGQYGGRISTVSRAVVILGFEQVRLAALSLLLFEHLDSETQAGDLRDAAGEAFLSGAIGRNLAGQLRGFEPEEVFVCAMLKTLGRYLTIYYLAEEHAEIRKAVELKGADEAAAARRVLGVTYEELGMAVAREWQLPATVVDSMRPLPGGPLARAAGKDEALRQAVSFSNELRDIAATTPPERREAALAELHQRFEKAIPIDEKTTSQVLESALEDVKEYAGAVGTDFRSTRAVKSAVSFLGTQESGDAADAAPADNPAVTESPLNSRHQTLMDGIQDITNALLEGCALNDVLVMILETIYRGCGVTHVVFCIADPKRQRMVARFGLGKEIETVTKRFQFSVRDADALCNAVRDKRDLIFPHPECPRDRLPEWLVSGIGPAAFAALPVVVRDVCVGMIYADFEQADRQVTAELANYLNTLRNQAALAVKQSRS